ncbi:hypothetical protein CRV03_10595 [Arcobacter sp. F155]|uniref:hypothetical protein n=1 Tax=Arcobacteraceae TaxID=2808963 RepID=UPI00100A2322|nr:MULTISPECIES: hypothetical protein [unclassified Arcobacter]RXJ76203.1 hypothetical protein CRV03_10595 [Arcobacter sp. F155]RXK01417.1 hypothetical protein CRV02_07860 [Arcobacter sp. CECT 8989]
MRITISNNEFNALQKILAQNDMTLYNRINEEFQKSMQSRTKKKIKATVKANNIKKKRSKEAVQNAVNILRLENKSITVYSVAKTAEISYNTAKKYKDFIQAQ